jgi:thiopurine S-methyltransferase
LDFSTTSIELFRKRCPGFPENRIINADFFEHYEDYDLIVEQTFFSSFHPDKRGKYADKMSQLLKPGGKLVGILFNHYFSFDGPPFGGTKEEYQKLFQPKFSFLHFDICYNSIKPRANRELFLLLRKN